MRVLIRHSADVNARDKNWQTPLHVAAANNALRCAEVIIPLLSSVNVSDRGGRTALHHAALNGHTEVPPTSQNEPPSSPLPIKRAATRPGPFVLFSARRGGGC